ncbi:MAG: hypothetical protein HFI97_01545 [Lachnospiraceae bacterium]|jgi:hypothetical protein|nr:hypothetical protein [Lachnospiraceae bacterium]MCI9202377.1 hypothetical protein [Lachnospiraceae bacterium]
MAKAWLEDKATWLFDLAHNDLDEDAIVKGFLKHYALQGQGVGNVQQDMHFHTLYGDHYLKEAMASLRRALEYQIEAPPRSEMRTLDEVQGIVDAVREGIRVQVDYYNPEIDDNPYVVRAAW